MAVLLGLDALLFDDGTLAFVVELGEHGGELHGACDTEELSVEAAFAVNEEAHEFEDVEVAVSVVEDGGGFVDALGFDSWLLLDIGEEVANLRFEPCLCGGGYVVRWWREGCVDGE